MFQATSTKGEVTDASFELAGFPLLSIPPDLSLIDPSWSTCTAETLGGFDPPRALTAAIALIPDPTAVSDPSTRAEPASSPIHPLPAQTLTAKPDPPTQTPGLGAIIYNAFGKSGPQDDGSSPGLLPPQSIFTIDAQTFTANPTGFKVNNTAIVPGGTAQTVDGMKISLDPSGVLAIGSSTISLTDPPATPLLAVAGQTFTPNPSAFSIAGSIISAGDPAVTISGTVISLGQSGALAIGSSTVDLLPSSKAFTVAGQVFTPNPSAFSIAGTTISAGGPAVTVDGTVISLQPSGNLILGSSTIPLLTPQATFSSDINIDGFNVKAGSSFDIVDGITLSAGAAGITISSQVVSLEAGGSTLDIGTGRFALPTPTGAANDSVNVQAFTGGQSKELKLSLSLVCGVCGTLMLLM